MDYKKTLILAILVLSIFSFTKLRFLDDHLAPGEELEMFTSFVNRGTSDVENVRVIAFLPDLGDFVKTSNFDVNNGDNYGNMMWWDVPQDAPKGEYLVRISAGNEDHKVRKFRYITVE